MSDTPNTTPTPADRQEAAGECPECGSRTFFGDGGPTRECAGCHAISPAAGEDGALPELTSAQVAHLWDTFVGEPTVARPLTLVDKVHFANAVIRQADGAFMRGFKEAKRQDLGAYDRGVISGLRQAASICSDREDMTADALRTEIEAALATHPAPAPTDQPEALSAAGEDGALPELPALPKYTYQRTESNGLVLVERKEAEARVAAALAARAQPAATPPDAGVREALRLSKRALEQCRELKDPWRLEAIAAVDAALAAQPTPPAEVEVAQAEELPGMWDASDLFGGEADTQAASKEGGQQ
jgi:hypothetical protein